MSRPTSRLNTLLRVRRIQEEMSRQRLAANAVAERGAERALEQAREHYASPETEWRLAPKTTQTFLAQRSHRVALAAAVQAAGTTVEEAASSTLVARHEWSEAAMRMTALERLEDRAREVARTELLAAEQRTSEESSSAQRHRGAAGSTQGKRP
jgi:hypothetical protein